MPEIAWERQEVDMTNLGRISDQTKGPDSGPSVDTEAYYKPYGGRFYWFDEALYHWRGVEGALRSLDWTATIAAAALHLLYTGTLKRP